MVMLLEDIYLPIWNSRNIGEYLGCSFFFFLGTFVLFLFKNNQTSRWNCIHREYQLKQLELY
jgi:hypothetical protein